MKSVFDKRYIKHNFLYVTIILVIVVIAVLLILFFTHGHEKEQIENGRIEDTDTDMTNEQPEYMQDEELCDLAGKYYAAHSENGFVPPIIEVDGEMEDGKVLIHLYEIVEDHTATYDWYTVDRVTGMGTNLNFEEINLLETK